VSWSLIGIIENRGNGGLVLRFRSRQGPLNVTAALTTVEGACQFVQGFEEVKEVEVSGDTMTVHMCDEGDFPPSSLCDLIISGLKVHYVRV
jgi:hypothetical protein